MQAWLEPVTVNTDTLAGDAVGAVEPGGYFFGSPHTLEPYDTIFYEPIVSDWRNVEAWEKDGEHDTLWRANKVWNRMLKEYEQPPLDPGSLDGLNDYAAKRTRLLFLAAMDVGH